MQRDRLPVKTAELYTFRLMHNSGTVIDSKNVQSMRT